MLTSKQRAYLRGLANPLDTILQVGKGGVGDALTKQVDDALTAREIIKMRVLPTCELSAHQTADLLAQQTNAQVVQVIGTRFILYRSNPEKKMIELK